MANETTVVADVDGVLIAWSNGYFSSDDRALLQEVKSIAFLGELGLYDPLPLAYGTYEPIMPGSRTALAAAAAMKSVFPGRTVFPVVPDVFLDYLYGEYEDYDEYADEESVEYA